MRCTTVRSVVVLALGCVLPSCASGSTDPSLSTTPAPSSTARPPGEVALPRASSAGAPQSTRAVSQVRGRVERVERCGPEKGPTGGCRRVPVAADVRVHLAGDKGAPPSSAVQEVRTSADGSFALALAPGDYLLSGSSAGIICTPVRLTVAESTGPSVVLECDTGIR